jgi:hypothetical protein
MSWPSFFGDYIMDYELDGDISINAIRYGHQQDPDLAKSEDFDLEAEVVSTSNLEF